MEHTLTDINRITQTEHRFKNSELILIRVIDYVHTHIEPRQRSLFSLQAARGVECVIGAVNHGISLSRNTLVVKHFSKPFGSP
jgi:hypothetical protein